MKTTWDCASDFLVMASRLQVAANDCYERKPELSKRLERLCDTFLDLAALDLETALNEASRKGANPCV